MEFTFAHPPYCARGNLQEVEITVVKREQEAFGEQIVSHQDGDLVFPYGVDGRETTSRI